MDEYRTPRFKRSSSLDSDYSDYSDTTQRADSISDGTSDGHSTLSLNREFSLDSGTTRVTINVSNNNNDNIINIQLDINNTDKIDSIKDKILSILNSYTDFDYLIIDDIMVMPKMGLTMGLNMDQFHHDLNKMRAVTLIKLLTNGNIKIIVNAKLGGSNKNKTKRKKHKSKFKRKNPKRKRTKKIKKSNRR